jgi:putative alpha-1,2-mannosidase
MLQTLIFHVADADFLNVASCEFSLSSPDWSNELLRAKVDTTSAVQVQTFFTCQCHLQLQLHTYVALRY